MQYSFPPQYKIKTMGKKFKSDDVVLNPRIREIEYYSWIKLSLESKLKPFNNKKKTHDSFE